MGLFDFIQDIDNYEGRAVATYKEDGLFVDTCAVSDSDKPFETAVSHPDYNSGKLVVVELYDTKEQAQVGHDKWVHTMLNNPPRQLTDVSTAGAAVLLRAMDALPPRERAES